MAEVAGLVLGGIPLAIWALEKYAEPFEAYHKYRTSIETFRTDLILQNRQLQTTLANIGLDAEPTMEELRECFDAKFPGIASQLMFVVQHMDEVTAGLMKSLDIDVNGKPSALQDKVQWEWRRVRHSLSTKKRNKVVEDLRRWNEDLRRSLEKPEAPAEDDSRKVQDLKRRFNIQRCNSIRQCLSSLHRALESGFRCACSPPHQAAIDLDWNAYESDPAKSFKLAVSYRTRSLPAQELDSWRRLNATSKTISPLPELLTPTPLPARAPSPTSSLRSKVAAQFRLVRSSSRTPPPPPTPPAATSPPNLSRASTVVSTSVPAELVSHCTVLCTRCKPSTLSGILKDPDEELHRQFHLDHNQTDSAKVIKMVSVKSLLSCQDQSVPGNTHLSLSAKQRYGIAASIAWSVLHLSGSSWLGDGWDEKQAGIFLEKYQADREVVSRHPCASYIFNTSSTTPATPEAQPPANDFKHLVPNRTIFTLGILLIELCINKSFEEIRRTREDISTQASSLLDDYQAALSKLDEVYRLAGDSYGYAAARCVKCSFPVRDVYKDFDFSTFRQLFYDTVVAPVQATYLMIPDSRIPV